MLTPKPEYLPLLIGKDAVWFARWLVDGLRTYLFGNAELKPRSQDSFPGAAAFINAQGHASVIDDLSAIFKALPEDHSKRVETACRRTLALLDLNDQREIEVAEHIVILGVRIRAFGLFNGLRQLWAKGLHRAACEQLSDTVLTALRDIAVDGVPEIAECVCEVVDAWDRFPPERSGTALIAMTRSDPDHLLDHLKFLYWPMEEHYGSGDLAERLPRRRAIIEDVGAAVGNLRVLRASAVGSARRPVSRPRDVWDTSIVGDWWAKTINFDEDPAMEELRHRLRIPQPKPQLAARADFHADQQAGIEDTNAAAIPDYDLPAALSDAADEELKDPGEMAGYIESALSNTLVPA